MERRPIFHADLGAYFRELRAAKGWGQAEAAHYAERRHLDAVTRQVLLRLEVGKTKNPEPEVLRAVAYLYGVTYEELVIRCVEAQYEVEMRPAKPGEPRPETKVQPELTIEDQLLVSLRRLADKRGRLREFMKFVAAGAEAMMLEPGAAPAKVASVAATGKGRVLPIRPRKPKKK
jgi:transcriptional regulator with XRE-family HTH domain